MKLQEFKHLLCHHLDVTFKNNRIRYNSEYTISFLVDGSEDINNLCLIVLQNIAQDNMLDFETFKVELEEREDAPSLITIRFFK